MHWAESDYDLNAGQHDVLPEGKGKGKGMVISVCSCHYYNKEMIGPTNYRSKHTTADAHTV